MTFQNKQEKLFFGIIHLLTKDDPNKRLTEEEIISNVSTKISRAKAIELFTSFSAHNIKYIEEDNSNKYRISDAGMVYYEQLFAEWEMEIEQRKIWNATTSSINWAKANIIAALLLTSITTFVVVKNRMDAKERENKETEKSLKDSLQQSEINQSVLQLKEELHQISQSLKDTSKVKVKIEK